MRASARVGLGWAWVEECLPGLCCQRVGSADPVWDWVLWERDWKGTLLDNWLATQLGLSPHP